MDKDKIKSLIKQAHDLGFEIASSNLKWDINKSWVEFLKQNNLKSVHLFSLSEKKQVVQYLLDKKQTIREIAKQLGYKNPGSITYIINSPLKKKGNRKTFTHLNK